MVNRIMRLGLVSVALFVAGLLSTTGIAQDSGPKAPKMVFESPEHDFGKVKEGEQVAFTFSVKNAGTAELVIANVSPGCGCTASDFTKIVAPGAEGKITLSVNTTGMSGKQSRYADVISNDKQQPNFKLWVHVEVQKTENLN